MNSVVRGCSFLNRLNVSRALPGFVPATVLVLITAMGCQQRAHQGRLETGLYYESLGRGPHALVLHGGPGLDCGYLRPSLDGLATHRRITFFDQRGTGHSQMELQPEELTVSQFVLDVESVRKSLPDSPEKIDLIGHSWGGVLALHYALTFPQRVRSLVLIDSSDGKASTLTAFQAFLQKHRSPKDSAAIGKIMSSPDFKSAKPAAFDLFFRHWYPVYFADPSKLSRLTIATAPATARNVFTVLGAINKDAARLNLYARMKELRIPVLIVHGRQSPIPADVASKLHAHLPKSRLIWIERSGHFPFVEQPEAFFKVVNGFLTSTASAPTLHPPQSP